MKLVYLGIISTGTIIVLGIAMVVPAFTQRNPDHSIPSVILLFSITSPDNGVSNWCEGLSSILEKHEVKATVFVTGIIAESNPECVSSFSSDIDIGSQTYSYRDLTSISDYNEASNEVKRGKKAVDEAGALDSRIFKAPYGKTDDNIYSLLSTSNIIADFSYVNHYNRYENNQFILYDLKSLKGQPDDIKLFSLVSTDDDVVRPYAPVPIAINFDNSMKIADIDSFISQLKSHYGANIRFVNASDVVGQEVTIHDGVK